MAEYVLPLPTPANVSGSKGSEIDEVAWTDRLLSILRYLSDQSISTLLSLSGLKQMFVALSSSVHFLLKHHHRRPNIFDVYLETCIKHNVCISPMIMFTSLISLLSGWDHRRGRGCSQTETWRCNRASFRFFLMFCIPSPILTQISVLYPDRQKACEDLRAFAKLNENRLYKLMKTCMDPQTDVKALVKATVSAHLRISEVMSSMNLFS